MIDSGDCTGSGQRESRISRISVSLTSEIMEKSAMSLASFQRSIEKNSGVSEVRSA